MCGALGHEEGESNIEFKSKAYFPAAFHTKTRDLLAVVQMNDDSVRRVGCGCKMENFICKAVLLVTRGHISRMVASTLNIEPNGGIVDVSPKTTACHPM